MKTIKIKFEGTEVEKKYVSYSDVLEILKKEDKRHMEVYEIFKEKDEYLAEISIQRAIETDVIKMKLEKMFGGEYD